MIFSLVFHIYNFSFFFFLLISFIVFYYSFLNPFFFNTIWQCHYYKFLFKSYSLLGDPNSRASHMSLNEAPLLTNIKVQTLTVSVTFLWKFLLRALFNTVHANKSVLDNISREFRSNKTSIYQLLSFLISLYSKDRWYSWQPTLQSLLFPAPILTDNY